MKKLLILMGILMIALAGCAIPVTDTNGTSTNETTNISLDLGNTTLDNSSMKDDKEMPDETNDAEMEDKEDETTEDEEPVVETKPVDTSLPTKTIKEGETIEFKKDLAYDPDGDALNYEFSTPLSKDGVWETELGDAGSYEIEVIVSDGKLESIQKFLLVVESVNNLPVISNFEDITVKEGETIEINAQVSDEDGDAVTVTVSGFMDSDTYETTYEDSGKYTVTLTADDGKQSVKETIQLVIEEVNRKPTIEDIENIQILEGETATVNIDAKDPDGDALSITIGEPFDNAEEWETKIGDKGNYEVEVIASDGELEAKTSFEVLVKVLNNAPTLTVDEEITVMEGEKIELSPEIADADGDALRVTYSGFMTSSAYQTEFDDEGEYETTISVSDGKETVEKTIKITITNKNRAPVFNPDWFE